MPEFRDLAKLQESQFLAWEDRQKIIDRVLLANYRSAYKETMAQIASLYAKVGLDDPVKGVYIRKEDAIRYNQLGNRLANLEDELKALGKKGVRLTEENSAQSIQDGYYRNAWAYTQTVGMELGIPALPIDAIREAVYPSLRFGPKKETGLNLVSTWNKNSTDMLYKTQSALMRGITMGQSYTKMAGSIKTEFDKGLWQAMRVVRTEAGRCWSEGAEKSHEAAIEAGLDVKKRWSAALDSRTRLSHARLDGTYADKDGLFHISGSSAPQPRQFGVAAEDINCRCAVYDVLEGLEPTMRRIRDLEGDDGYSSEKAKSRIVPYQSFETWAKPQGWTADKGWPKVTTTAAQADKAVKATPTVKTGVFVPAKTVNEAKQWAENNLGIKTQYNRTTMGVEAQNIVNKRLLELSKEWNFNIKFTGDTKSAWASANNREMNFNPNLFDNPTSFKKSLVKNVESKFHPKGCDTIESIVDHEFAHTITSDDLIHFKGMPKSDFRVSIEKIRRDYRKNFDKDTYISVYADKNYDEFVAESFAMVLNSDNPSPWASQVVEAMNKKYRRAK